MGVISCVLLYKDLKTIYGSGAASTLAPSLFAIFPLMNTIVLISYFFTREGIVRINEGRDKKEAGEIVRQAIFYATFLLLGVGAYVFIILAIITTYLSMGPVYALFFAYVAFPGLVVVAWLQGNKRHRLLVEGYPE